MGVRILRGETRLVLNTATLPSTQRVSLPGLSRQPQRCCEGRRAGTSADLSFYAAGGVANRLIVCNNTRFCCAGAYKSDEECCQNSFTLARGVGTPQQQLGTSPASNACTSDSSAASGANGASTSSGGATSNTAAITGGVLGTLLLAVSVALVIVVLHNRRLKVMLSEKATLAGQTTPELNYKYQHTVPYSRAPQEVSAVISPTELPTTGDYRELR